MAGSGPHLAPKLKPTGDSRGVGPRGAWLRRVSSLVILALLFWLLPFGQLIDALARIPAWAWALSMPAYLCLHLLGVAKWRLLINAAGAGLSFRQAARCYYYGLFGNTFLPSVVGGEVLRLGLAFRLSPSRGGIAVGTAAERSIDLLALAAVAGLGVLLLPGALDAQGRQAALAPAVVAVAAVLAAAALTLLLRRPPKKLRRLLVRVRRPLRAMWRRPSTLILAFALAVGLQTSLVFLNAWLGRACGMEIPLTAWLFVWPIAKLSALLPLTQGGLGVREAALAVLFAPLGVSAVLAVAAGLVFEAVIISGGLVGGGLAYVLALGDSETSAGVGGDGLERLSPRR